MVDAGNMSDNDENTGSNDPNQDDGVLAFLENANGILIFYDEKKLLYHAMRGFWNDHIGTSSDPPGNWSSAGETLQSSFCNFLESQFFYLRLCAGRWKAEELWKWNYHSWLWSFVCRSANASSRQHKQKHAEDTRNNNNKTISQTKKAKMKAQAISVDSDTPDADCTDPAWTLSDATNAVDNLHEELNKVFHYFF